MTAPRTPNRHDPPSHTPRRSSPESRPRSLPARPAAVRHAATPLGVRPPELIPLDPTTEAEVVTLLAGLLVDWLTQRDGEPTPPRPR